jgi:hypothetical protein
MKITHYVSTFLILGVLNVLSHGQSAYGYEIGVHYQPSMWAPEWKIGNWLYAPLMSASNNGQDDKGGFNGVRNQRVPRVYPERQPLVNGLPKWLDIMNQSDVNAEVDSMKLAGIDHMIYQVPWSRNTDPTLPYGFSGFQSELKSFIQANIDRKVANQVRFSLLFGPEHDIKYKNREDFINVFEAKVQLAITYFKTKDTAKNPLYYYREGKPMLTFWDTGTYMKQASVFGVTMAELIQRSQKLAITAGYTTGIYWLDSANTLMDRTMNNPHGGNYSVKDYITYQDMIAEAGFNAESGYFYHGVTDIYGPNANFTGYNQAIQAFAAIWDGLITGAKKHAGFKYFVLVSPGWDSRAIGEFNQPSGHDRSRSCDGAFDSAHNSDKLPYGCSEDNALFATMLGNAKTRIDQNQDTTAQMVIVGTWNDVLEGHYIIPTKGDGGAHARALRNVFKPNNQNISIYYGSNGRMITRVFSAGTPVACSSKQFGGDPSPYELKACYNEAGIKLADETGPFIVAKNYDPAVSIRFGVAGAYATKSFPSGSIVMCSWQTFGDPSPGVAKTCIDDDGNALANEGLLFVVPI